MKSPFHVGEIAIYHKPLSPNHGALVTIHSEAFLTTSHCAWTRELHHGYGHDVEFLLGYVPGPYTQGESRTMAMVYQLRKLDNPDAVPVQDAEPIQIDQEVPA